MVKRVVTTNSIVLDARLQCRAHMSSEAIEDYRELLVSNPDTWPFDSPIEIVQIGERLYVTDGFTRANAAISAGRLHVEAHVIVGDWELAVRRAIQANAHNGQRRTREDKRRAVEVALKELPKGSDSQIAKACLVSQGLVASLRSEFGAAKGDNVTGADGKQYPAKSRAKADKPAKAPQKAQEATAAKQASQTPPPAPDVKAMPQACECGANDWVETRHGLQCAVCVRGYPATVKAPAAATGPREVDGKRLAAARTAFGRLVRAVRKLDQPDSYLGPALDRLNELLAAIPEIEGSQAEASGDAEGNKPERAA